MHILRLTRWSFVAVLILLTGCEKMDIRGMFVSYETVNERFSSSMEWNCIIGDRELKIEESSYTVFAMGDSHIGGVINLKSFLQQAFSEGAVAAVGVGDLTSGREEDYNTFYQQTSQVGPVHFFPMVGNHDLYSNGWKTFKSLYGSSVYFFTVQSPMNTDLFICLDSGSGTLGSRQTAWLRKLLQTERVNHRYCVIFTHNNLFRSRQTTSTNLMVEEVQALMELCLLHQVNLVVTGHDHKRSTETLGNTRFIIMDALLDGFKDAGYLKIKVNQDGIDYEFYRF
jgi:predicted phosphodiesterase